MGGPGLRGERRSGGQHAWHAAARGDGPNRRGDDRRPIRPGGVALILAASARKPSGSGITVGLDARQLLDVAQIGPLVIRHEADRHARRAGARGAADAVDVLLRHVGQLEVEHMADARHVDAARGDVGRDQHLDLADLELAQRALALRLALVAVDRVGGDAGMAEQLHDAVGAVLGAGEDQAALDLRVAEMDGEQRLLFRLADEGGVLLDALGGGRRPARPSPVAGSFRNWSASSRIALGMVAEKNRVWRCAGTICTILRSAWMKPRSSIWSASSRTRISSVARLTKRCSIRSSRRPGVGDEDVDAARHVVCGSC